MRQRLIRDGPALRDSAVLVRALFDTDPDGRVFDREVLIADATYNFDEFGYYGLSLWLVSESWPLDRVLGEKCRRANRVVVFEAGALQSSGLGLVPSGREPHYDASLGRVYGRLLGSDPGAMPTAAQLVARFMGASYTVRDNPFYDPGQD